MAKFNKEQRKEIAEEVFFNTEKNIRSTRVTMCSVDGHKWRKFSDTEIACEICPTVNIVGDTSKYVK